MIVLSNSHHQYTQIQFPNLEVETKIKKNKFYNLHYQFKKDYNSQQISKIEQKQKISMNQSSNFRKQNQIPYQTRKQLIKLVVYQKLSIQKAHIILALNYSTAKMIIRKYRIEGKITKFNKEKEVKTQIQGSVEQKKGSNLEAIKQISKKQKNELENNSKIENNFKQTEIFPLAAYNSLLNYVNFQNMWLNFISQYWSY